MPERTSTGQLVPTPLPVKAPPIAATAEPAHPSVPERPGGLKLGQLEHFAAPSTSAPTASTPSRATKRMRALGGGGRRGTARSTPKTRIVKPLAHPTDVSVLPRSSRPWEPDYSVTPDTPAPPAVEDIPRLTEHELFDPKRRRPSLRDFLNVKPKRVVDRHSGIRTDPEARVSVYRETLPARVSPVQGATPQQRGLDYERALRDDLIAGTKYREGHSAGDRARSADIGRYEAKYKDELASDDLDQIWRDLVAYDKAVVIMPELRTATEDNLSRLAAIFEHVTGRRPHITVRETGP